MWMQNNYVRSIAGVAIAGVLFVAVAPERGTADDTELSRRSTDRTTQRPSPYADSTALLQASGNSYARYEPGPLPRPPVPQTPPSMSNFRSGLPTGEWHNDSPLGRVKMSISGNKMSITVEGAGQFAMFKPSLRGEFSVASDGTIYGLIHSVDLGIPALAAAEMGEEMLLLNGLSDIPFSMRAYSEPGVLAVKQVTFGMPMQVAIATDGDYGELGVYVQSMLTGQYDQSK